MSNTTDVIDRESEFKALDKSRLVHLGNIRAMRVYRHAVTGEYWLTTLGDFVSHHLENPLPRD